MIKLIVCQPCRLQYRSISYTLDEWKPHSSYIHCKRIHLLCFYWMSLLLLSISYSFRSSQLFRSFAAMFENGLFYAASNTDLLCVLSVAFPFRILSLWAHFHWHAPKISHWTHFRWKDFARCRRQASFLGFLVLSFAMISSHFAMPISLYHMAVSQCKVNTGLFLVRTMNSPLNL